jgi:hypothetical protein
MWTNSSFPISRREMLSRFASGFGTLGLAHLLGSEAAGSPAHFAAKAKRVIFLFMSGGPSHVDLFDQAEAHRDGRPAAAIREAETRTRQDRQLVWFAVSLRQAHPSATEAGVYRPGLKVSHSFKAPDKL